MNHGLYWVVIACVFCMATDEAVVLVVLGDLLLAEGA